MRIAWLITGTVAAAGVFWLTQGALRFAPLRDDLILLLGALAAGLTSGALVASHVPVRPTREPLVVAVLGTALVVAASFAIASAEGWGALDSPVAWVVVVATVVTAASGIAGAAVIRRLKGVTVSTLSVMLLSAAVHFGALVVLFAATTFAGAHDASLLVAFGGVFLAGFLTQLALPIRAPWASASGVVLFPLFGTMNGQSTGEIVALIVGSLVLMLIGRIGSAIANAIARPPVTVELPAARMR
ncbi:MAG: hypothetical protein SFX73_27535 [Kofleriaceae bacterium]|nr:hypothetical protein [Kofleriaceae bacterium]